MALKATIFKATLQVADLDRGYYAGHNLTLARHPSETDERLMVRLLAFGLHASPRLQFSRGLSSNDEADLCQRNEVGEIDLWIEVGLPDAERLRRVCGRARRVCVYSYGGRAVGVWWHRNAPILEASQNLQIVEIPEAATKRLAQSVERSMDVQLTIQEGEVFLRVGAVDLQFSLHPLMRARAGEHGE